MCSIPSKFYELCRLCLSRDGAKLSIFDEEGTRRNFQHKLTSCLPVNIYEDDDLPNLLCEMCIVKLDALHAFRETSARSEVALRQYLESPHDMPDDADEDLRMVYYQTQQSVEDLEVVKEECVVSTVHEEEMNVNESDCDNDNLYMKEEDKEEEESSVLEPQAQISEPESPTRRHQEFLRHVVEIISNRMNEANSLLRSLMSTPQVHTGRPVILMREEVKWPTPASSPNEILTNRTNIQSAPTMEVVTSNESRTTSAGRRKQSCLLRTEASYQTPVLAKPPGQRLYRSAEAISRLLEAANYTGSDLETNEHDSGDEPNTTWCGTVDTLIRNNRVPKRMQVACSNCGTKTTTIWRRNPNGEKVCNISDDDVIIIEDTKIKTEVLSPEQPMQDCIDEDANQHEDLSFFNVTKHDEIPKLDINDKVENVQVKIPDVENLAQSPAIVKNPVIDEIDSVERNSFIFKDENMPHSDDDTILDVENSDSSSLPSKIEHIISNTCIENTDANQNAYEEVNECRQEEIPQYKLPTDFSQKEQVRLVIRNATQINESTNPTYTPKFKTPAELKERFNPVLNYEGNVQMRVVETGVNNTYAHTSTSSYNHEQNVKPLSMMIQPITSSQNHDNMRFITPAQLKEGLSQTMNAMQHNDNNLPQVSGEILRYSQEDGINSLMALQRSDEYQQMSPTTEAQHHEPQPSGSNQQPIQNPTNLEHCNLLSNYCDYNTNMNNPDYNYANQSTVVLPEFACEQPQVETREVYEPPPTTPVNTVHRTQTYSPPIPSNFFFFPNFSEQFIKNATFFEPDKQLDSDLDDDKGETTWLHKIVMRRDNYMFLIQEKARQLLLKNEHVMIPPAPEKFKILEPKMRCSCKKCHDNLKNLWTNYILLFHHRKSKEMLEESSSIKGWTIEDEKRFKEMGEQVKNYLIRAGLAETENSWSLPLKKRKAISHLQPPKDNSDSISYPSTPMLSIAVLEERKLTGADLNVNTRNYYLPRYTNVNIPPPTHGYNPHMVPSSSQANVQIPNRSYEAMLSNLCSPPPQYCNIAHSSKSYYVEPSPPRQTETKPKAKGKTRGTRGRKRKHI